MRTHGMIAGKGGGGGDGSGCGAEWGGLVARVACVLSAYYTHTWEGLSKGLETLRQIKRPLRWIHVCIVESLPHTCWSATICTGLSFLPCCCLVPVAAVFLG